MSNVETRRVDAIVTVGSMAVVRGNRVRLVQQAASLRGPGEASAGRSATLFTRPASYVESAGSRHRGAWPGRLRHLSPL